MKLKSKYMVGAHAKVALGKWRTGEKEAGGKAAAAKLMEKYREQLNALQEVLYAEEKHAVLIVLQGMDTAGKDGTIRHIFTGVNPQGCKVTSFKVPTALEMRHDFLWRVHSAVPPKGTIGIFNRSHYEDVLITRVHKEIDGKEARLRCKHIVDFEQMLAESGTLILKFFLHISRDEQKRRLDARVADPDKRWKVNTGDYTERKLWPEYQAAYEDALERTSRKHAPWFVIPADDKRFRNCAISKIIVEAMQGLKMEYPKATFDPASIKD